MRFANSEVPIVEPATRRPNGLPAKFLCEPNRYVRPDPTPIKSVGWANWETAANKMPAIGTSRRFHVRAGLLHDVGRTISPMVLEMTSSVAYAMPVATGYFVLQRLHPPCRT